MADRAKSTSRAFAATAHFNRDDREYPDPLSVEGSQSVASRAGY